MQKRVLKYSASDTIAAISTPPGEGGIGIVRLSGKKALSIADKIFMPKDKSKPSAYKTYTTHYGYIIRPVMQAACRAKEETQSGKYATHLPAGRQRNTKYEIVDEVILTVMRAPKSYTREDIVEINCHGGIVALREVLELALSFGARLAEPGEFTKRAFINGRIDLAQAEAVLDIIRSKTEGSMKVAISQLEGKLSKKIRYLKNHVLEALSEVEASIDFSEEDIEFMTKEKLKHKLTMVSETIKELIEGAWKGLVLKEGVMCVICGKPNVGKSSLMNVLLRRNRVIVTPVPGTTRDAIEEVINLGNIPVRVVDTAGISVARNIIEKHGIRKSRSYIRMADLIIFMLDLSRPWQDADRGIFNNIKNRNFIILANKSDLKRKLNVEKVMRITGKEIITTSLLRKRNIDKIEKAILGKLWRGEIIQPEGAFIASLRHKKDLENARKHIIRALSTLADKVPEQPEIVASELREAVFFLGSILGDTVEPDILDKIFSNFCIGK